MASRSVQPCLHRNQTVLCLTDPPYTSKLIGPLLTCRLWSKLGLDMTIPVYPVVKPLLSLEHPHFGIKFRDRKFALSLRGGERRHRCYFETWMNEHQLQSSSSSLITVDARLHSRHVTVDGLSRLYSVTFLDSKKASTWTWLMTEVVCRPANINNAINLSTTISMSCSVSLYYCRLVCIRVNPLNRTNNNNDNIITYTASQKRSHH